MSAYNETTDSDCFPTSSQVDILAYVCISFGAFSFLSCILTLSVAVLFQKYRSTTQRVILYLTITVLLNSLVYALHGIRDQVDGYKDMDDRSDNVFCVSLAFIDQIVSWMELFAICCLTFDLFVKAVFLYFNTERFEIIYGVLIFIGPFLFNWVPFIHHTYGFAGSYCWIIQYRNLNCSEYDKFGVGLRFGLYWVPFYIIMSTILVAYIVAMIKARKRIRHYSCTPSNSEQTIREMLHSEVRQYQLYPFIIIIIFSLAIISRIAEAVDHNRSFYELRILHIIAMCLQGPLIAIVFSLDYDTRKQLCNCQSLRNGCFHLFCCCKVKRVSEYEASIYSHSPRESLLKGSKSAEDGPSYTPTVI